MNEPHNLSLPSRHLNGTGFNRLFEEAEEAYQALLKATQALEDMTINMRDFYVQEDGEQNFKRANEQHQARMDALASVRSELLIMMRHFKGDGQ